MSRISSDRPFRLSFEGDTEKKITILRTQFAPDVNRFKPNFGRGRFVLTSQFSRFTAQGFYSEAIDNLVVVPVTDTRTQGELFADWLHEWEGYGEYIKLLAPNEPAIPKKTRHKYFRFYMSYVGDLMLRRINTKLTDLCLLLSSGGVPGVVGSARHEFGSAARKARIRYVDLCRDSFHSVDKGDFGEKFLTLRNLEGQIENCQRLLLKDIGLDYNILKPEVETSDKLIQA